MYINGALGLTAKALPPFCREEGRYLSQLPAGANLPPRLVLRAKPQTRGSLFFFFFARPAKKTREGDMNARRRSLIVATSVFLLYSTIFAFLRTNLFVITYILYYIIKVYLSRPNFQVAKIFRLNETNDRVIIGLDSNSFER